MSELILHGLGAAVGVAVGRALVLAEAEPENGGGGGGEAERARAVQALAVVAAELRTAAERAQAEGRPEEAEILEANSLMAEDPGLVEEARAAAGGRPAAAAVREAAERQAALLAALDDPTLAARASDVRQIGRRAARLAAGVGAPAPPRRPTILIARDLGPADTAELELAGGFIRGIALADGSGTSHAAIMARALGLPVVVGLGDEVLRASAGGPTVLDGGRGLVALGPSAVTLAAARRAVRQEQSARRRRAAGRSRSSVTRDGRAVTLLANASTPAEVRSGLAHGAEGVGLLRTEFAFLEAPGWPSEGEHRAALGPVLAPLAGRMATVRTLDFGADKTPPFLAGARERGVALALAHPEALAAQLRAILAAGAATRLRILLPLVEHPAQVIAVREILDRCRSAVGWSGPGPELGAMIETPEAAERAGAIVAETEFLSIGTNDLVQYTLGVDRERPLASAGAAADPAVLRLMAGTVAAGHAAGRRVEVCGEAAGELALVPLLVGLGVDELSMAPARLDAVRETICRLAMAEAREAVDAALRSGEAGDERRQALHGLGSVVA